MQSFEDLIIRQRSKDLYHRIADVLEESKIYFFRDQILRATLSISNNIAEWYERETKKELVRFLYIAKWSCGEVRSMGIIAKERKMIDDEQCDQILSECRRISIMIHKYIASVIESTSST